VIPHQDTVLIVEDELRGTRRWTDRHRLPLAWLPARLEVRVPLKQPSTNDAFFLRGIFSDYKAIAPVWTFSDPKWESNGGAFNFPQVTRPHHGSPMFIMGGGGPVICVPFNRLAYAAHGGPHSVTDWGGPSNWLNAGPSYVQAVTIGDMLTAIYRDFCHTHGRMGPQ